MGGYLCRHWQEKYDLRLTDRKAIDYDISSATEFIEANTSDLEEMRALCRGMDTIVHLAADPWHRADFYGSLLENNVIGLYNGFQAAVDEGCRRMVYASSVNAVIGYPEDMEVTEDSLPNPPNHYGACKVFGEALGQSFFHQHGLSSLCIRFGTIRLEHPKEDPDTNVLWIAVEDAAHLIECCIEVEDVDFCIVHGFSDHRRCRFSIEKTRELAGFNPQFGTAKS